ncbi:MAG: hypothetical protein HKL84_00910 [Acidimicrobiaceae bacterium]|nr:hypothetical protein [Acidimicrobiaceae bacterium]
MDEVAGGLLSRDGYQQPVLGVTQRSVLAALHLAVLPCTDRVTSVG